VIIAANPVFIALFSFLLFGERFSPHRMLGILLSVSGAIIVVARGDIAAVLRGQVGVGEIALFGCVFSWVSYTLIGRRVLQGLSPLVAVTYSCIAGALALLPPALYTGLPDALGTLSPLVLGNLFYLSLFGTVLGFVWFYQGVKELGPARAGLFINLVPVSGVALGILLLDEQLSLSLLGGGGLVLTGLFLTNRVR
jgi:drug/metabolite transporter (DMT)-like permease